MGSLKHRLQYGVGMEYASYFCVAQISAMVTYVCTEEKSFIFLISVYESVVVWTITHSLVEHVLRHPRRAPRIITVLI